MKILVPVDENTYSMYAIRHAAKLAENTWPELVLLAMDKSAGSPDVGASFEESNPKARMLQNYSRDLLKLMGSNAELYVSEEENHGMKALGKNLVGEELSGRKRLHLHLRNAQPVKAVLQEAKEDGSDLIIIGCGQSGCSWDEDPQAPGKIADNADCPVLIIKDEHPVSKVVCCLDHADVTQESLEMINQLVTFHHADLEIVGVLKHDHLKEEVEQQMGKVLDYYLERGVRALVKVVNEDSLESFISTGTRRELMAVWLSPRSPMQRLFSREKVASLVNKTLSSILILR
ncbi:universal stress protein [Maridesulfovibrio sp.]|uniref:universal stress protein n=1 Tax=Maridesulfovibrio sp. TaxID=2795000 RepID=UPI002A18D914|nr:universal stress protein [Maridesulfovibrio sp.]